MKNMEEIDYWVKTGRPPCTYSISKLLSTSNSSTIEQTAPHNSKQNRDPDSPSDEAFGKPTAKKHKKERKISILDDESISNSPQKNVFFETSNRKSLEVSKKREPHKNNTDNVLRQNIRTKAKIIRRKQPVKNLSTQNHITNSDTNKVKEKPIKKQENDTIVLESSTDEVDHNETNNVTHSTPKSVNKKEQKPKSSNKIHNNIHITPRQQRQTHNYKDEDTSDISGLTASYIRSTKLNNSKNKPTRITRPRSCKKSVNTTLRSGNNKDIDVPQEASSSKVVSQHIYLNKSTNTGIPTTVNANTSESSTNVLNIVTSEKKSNKRVQKLDKSTSALNFRKPTQHRNSKIQKVNNSVSGEILVITRECRQVKRSPRRTGLQAKDSSNLNDTPRQSRSLSRRTRDKSLLNITNTKSASTLSRTRDKSGFSAVFSESDEDIPLARRKYFS